MRTTLKLALLDMPEARPARTGVFGHVKRALGAVAERRASRPLQDLDSWSDQAEVAFFEDGRAFRCP